MRIVAKYKVGGGIFGETVFRVQLIGIQIPPMRMSEGLGATEQARIWHMIFFDADDYRQIRDGGTSYKT